MKKGLCCIGFFMFLFLAVGLYTAQAQDLGNFDGKWLSMTVKPQKGLEFTGYDSTATPRKMNAGAGKIYACMDVDAAAPNTAYLRFFEKGGTEIGCGALYWDAGTNLEFLGYFEAYIATGEGVTYEPPANGICVVDPVTFTVPGTDTNLYGYVNAKGKAVDKLKIKSVSGEGYIQSPDATATTGTYAGFGYTLNGKSEKDTNRNLPAPIPACGEIVFD